MIFLPRTTPRIYVSSILALNINSPEHTGDWHSSMYWEHPENSKIDLWIFGDGQKFNTNHLLGELWIIDGTSRLNKWDTILKIFQYGLLIILGLLPISSMSLFWNRENLKL